jgi:hypothetical protein
MTTASETRFKEMQELHAPGKATRVQVLPNGPNLQEHINGSMKAFKAGEVFDHPAPKRAKQLIEIGLVRASDLPTPAELNAQKIEDEAAVDIVSQELREKAKMIVKGRKEKLDKFDKMIRRMKPDVLEAELKKRGMKEIPNAEEAYAALLADEEADIKKA